MSTAVRIVESVSSADGSIDEATDIVEKDVFGEFQAEDVDVKDVEVEGRWSNERRCPGDPKKGAVVSSGGVGRVCI